MSRHLLHPVVLGKSLLSSRSPVAQACSFASVSVLGKGLGTGAPRVLMAYVPLQPGQVLSASSHLPEVSQTYRYREVSSVSASSIQSQRSCDKVPDAHMVSGERHVLANRSSGVPMALEDIGSCKVSAHLKAFGH